MGFARADLTDDKFLGGQLTLMQPRDGYRAGLDPVFLAASITAHVGESVLDLGCGVGAAALCLGFRPGENPQGRIRHFRSGELHDFRR